MEFFYSSGVPIAQHSRSVQRWITLCAALVALMVLIGGATRLTESGLSIVKWKLVAGTLPPLSEEAWAKEFAEYQTSPQYEEVNSHFGIAEFRQIYWLEYLHRLLGRVTGLALLLPFIYFAARKQLSPPLLRRMGIAVVLVVLQGAVGWIMVASGLVNQPRVAPVKLALHLALAFTLFGLLLWTRWQVTGHSASAPHTGMARAGRWLLALLALQIVLGALVAGLRAGLSYNTWPLMDGQLIPDGLYLLSPWWKNHLENVLTVQFQHRVVAYTLVAAAFACAIRFWDHQPHRRLLATLVGMIGLQAALGIATVLTNVHLHIAIAHQLVALALVAVLMRLIYINTPASPSARP